MNAGGHSSLSPDIHGKPTNLDYFNSEKEDPD